MMMTTCWIGVLGLGGVVAFFSALADCGIVPNTSSAVSMTALHFDVPLGALVLCCDFI
jgi:hypothetical protein